MRHLTSYTKTVKYFRILIAKPESHFIQRILQIHIDNYFIPIFFYQSLLNITTEIPDRIFPITLKSHPIFFPGYLSQCLTDRRICKPALKSHNFPQHTSSQICLLTRPSYDIQPEHHHPHLTDPEYGSSSLYLLHCLILPMSAESLLLLRMP